MTRQKRMCALCGKKIDEKYFRNCKSADLEPFCHLKMYKPKNTSFDTNFVCDNCVKRCKTGTIVLKTSLPLERDKGLFAARSFDTSEIVIHKIGETRMQRLNSEETELSNSDYLFQIGGGISGDPHPFKSKVGYINHCIVGSRLYRQNVNIYLCKETNTFKCQARFPIKIGDEIFWDYGPSFFADKPAKEQPLTLADVTDFDNLTEFMKVGQARLLTYENNVNEEASLIVRNLGLEDPVIPVEEQDEKISQFCKEYRQGITKATSKNISPAENEN